MHSAEPLDPRTVTPATPPANEAWRAEIASRLQNYRTRHKKKGPDSLAFDFESPGNVDASGATAASDAEQETIQPRDAFDTNYYRRLNARAIEQSAPAAVASKPASVAAGAVEVEAENDFSGLASDEPQAAGPAFDWQLHAPAPGDPCLERYCIQAGAAPAEQSQACALEDAPAIACESVFGETEEPPVEPSALVAAMQSNLIVFPRPLLEPPLMPPPSRDELAEPVSARPRILEVPEDIMPAVQESLFPEIRLDNDESEFGTAEPEIELPLQVAPVAVRLTAALADLVVVLAAGGLFAAMADRALPDVPHAKPFWMSLAAVTMLLWGVYQAMFLLYAGRTLGMAMNGIHLSTFDGRAPEWKERRGRAIFSVISFASVGLGFLSALVDEDTLCWHDRVSQTFPTTH